ncbi:MAG: response regulator transcription factor [Anaerolineae bacterium]|nr:response regulator transcription factor [Anaerolineae bacterium]
MAGEKTIKVLVVDDHKVVRDGLKAFLLAYDDIELVGEARNGEDAVLFCAHKQPDVVLMDLVMPRMDGAEATRRILEINPAIKVIALTSFPEEDLVQNTLRAGAISYLLKDVEDAELATAIRSAMAGRSTLAPEAAQALIHAAASSGENLGHDITEREREVLALMVQGLKNNEIAERLFISYSTTKYHVSSILSKLGASSRTEAVSLALKHNLLKD